MSVYPQVTNLDEARLAIEAIRIRLDTNDQTVSALTSGQQDAQTKLGTAQTLVAKVVSDVTEGTGVAMPGSGTVQVAYFTGSTFQLGASESVTNFSTMRFTAGSWMPVVRINNGLISCGSFALQTLIAQVATAIPAGSGLGSPSTSGTVQVAYFDGSTFALGAAEAITNYTTTAFASGTWVPVARFGSTLVTLGSFASGSQIPDIQIFSATGANTWSKPAGAVFVRRDNVGAGGGGGSGRKGAAGTTRCGGGGGGGGGYSSDFKAASQFSASETVTIGAGGPGHVHNNSDTTNGSAGTAGGDTTMTGGAGAGTLTASGGGAGGGGTNNVTGGGAGGSAGSGVISNGGAGGRGAQNASGAVAGVDSSEMSGAGGGGGAGVTSTDTSQIGADGGNTPFAVSGKTAPTANTIFGGDGHDGACLFFAPGPRAWGGGGGAGGSCITTAATPMNGPGGRGGKFGAGGGGGAGGTNTGTHTSIGGDGGNGIVIVTTYFQ